MKNTAARVGEEEKVGGGGEGEKKTNSSPEARLFFNKNNQRQSRPHLCRDHEGPSLLD